ncbi:MAG TPA: hypothetical protein VJ732_06845, partial [Bryobacteraceae bacterium]|nr:hypothetical protein [Bryobacteraceae bacterium]
MRHRLMGSTLAAGMALVFGWLAPLPAAAESGRYTAPRTADGKPDLQGIWQAHNTANDSLEAHSGALGIAAGESFIVDPPDGKIPYKPEALKTREENFKNRATADPVNKCFIPGVPRITYLNFPFQIFETPKYVLMAYEYVHNYRTIYMDGSQHLDGIDFWGGDSRGHWEGDTLVVDVADFNDQTWLDKSGDFHSDELHVVERYTRTGPDTLRYEATIEDPKTYTRPW